METGPNRYAERFILAIDGQTYISHEENYSSPGKLVLPPFLFKRLRLLIRRLGGHIPILTSVYNSLTPNIGLDQPRDECISKCK